MTLPTSASKANLDSATDDPKLVRPDLADLVDKFNDLLTHLNLSTITSGPAAIPLSIANGGTSAATASAARTALGVEDATETAAGRIEIATQTEANNGTDDTRAITPLKLSNISPASVTYAAADQVLLLDASDSNKLKRATITAGKLLQQVAASTSAYSTGTSQILADNSKPQSTEGTELLTATITPSSASSILLIEADVVVGVPANATIVVAALFQDSAANAIAATADTSASGTIFLNVTIRHRMTAGTTSATTIKLRVGPASATTLHFNGNSATAAGIFDGVCSSILTVTEIAA